MILFLIMSALSVGSLYAAPLESGFALAPPASASMTEKAAAYQKARTRLLTAAEKYERTPYRLGGVDRRGLDCSGFVYVSFRDALGVTVPRDTGSLYSWAEKIQIERAQPGDLVFFNTTGSGRISHVGIYIGNGRFIHSASEGPATGVIYSSLSERYWSRTYAGAGRALPPSNMGGSAVTQADNISPAATTTPVTGNEAFSPTRERRDIANNILIGFAIAPSWNTYFTGDNIIRGAVGQFRLAAEVNPFGKSMILGVELRSEWDGALGVFRLPLTLSWGLNDNLRFFAGPVVSFGDATLTVAGEDRRYTGGTSWLGTAGVTFAPFKFQAGESELAPYGELAWQSYSNDNSGSNFGADFAAGFRFSTGIRCTWNMN